MALTVQEFAAQAVEKGAEDLIRVALKTPADRREWEPLGRGRTALNQVVECALINGGSVTLIETHAWPAEMADGWEPAVAALDTLDKAVDSLRENTVKFAASIRATPDDILELPIPLPWKTVTLAECFLIPYWNMAYHEGQITYIQTLCETSAEAT